MGDITGWGNGSELFEANCCGSAEIVNDSMYLLGGYSTDYTDKVYFVSIAEDAKMDLIFLLPGMLASWNYEAMVHNQNVPNSEWNFLPGLTLYDGLIDTFKDNGYEEGKDLYVYNYDWRKKISENGASFCEFANQISSNHNDQKIKVVGHSMGGLVARSCMQSPQGGVIDQLITVGSPHQGATKAYLAWEGAEYPSFVPGLGFALGLATRVIRKDLDSRVQVFRKAVPSAQDLLPTFNYLKKDDKEIALTKMKWNNNFLPNLNSGLVNILSMTSTLTGTDIETQK
jgi:pimeloyl-ACP methyl ester carboxylesterase